MSRLVGVPKERPLENTYWVLVEINGNAIVRNDVKLFIQLNPDLKRVTGFAGCNQIGGDYELNGKKLSFKTSSTRMFCENKMEIESAFLQALNEVNGFSITEHDLSLMHEKNVLLKFQADTKTSH